MNLVTARKFKVSQASAFLEHGASELGNKVVRFVYYLFVVGLCAFEFG